jgi:hypothetical protein
MHTAIVLRKSVLTALAVAGIVAMANAPSLAAPTQTASTVLSVSATVLPLCQDFMRPDGSRTTVCNNVHAIIAPSGATAIGSLYSAGSDGGAPLVEHRPGSSQTTVIYF